MPNKISHRPRSIAWEPLGFLSWQRLNPIKLESRPAQLTASAFNQLGQYANSPGHRAYCYAELAVSSLAIVATISSSHFACPRRDDQAELAWVAWLNTRSVYSRMVTYLRTNSAQCRTLTMCSTTLPFNQTFKPGFSYQ